MLSPTPESPTRIPDDSDFHDAAFAKRGCCLWLPCMRQWDRIEAPERKRRGAAGEDEEERQWWMRGWDVVMKVREWSEIAAGPKWKTFIRRFGRNRMMRSGGSKFRYDPLSYALNFDESAIQSSNSYDEDLLRRDFSARYASIPGSAKSTMDTGREASF
uniref:Uncharacterized protein n=1 Tax=Kalanchoe fedtschenkoi TaxID=63787 RepID=A0A7N0ZVG6_KALFE